MATKFSRKDFLEALYSEYFRKREGFIMVRTVKRLDPRVSTRYFPNLEILAKEHYQEDQNVFFGVCPHENMKADKGQISYITAIWAGLDFNSSGHSGTNFYFSNKAQAAKAIRSFPLPPSIIVESGWGVHLYWLLTEVTPLTSIEAAERVLSGISSYFLNKSGVKIDSVMRLPGSFNCKVPGQMANCFVKYINNDFRYTLEDFVDLSFSADGPVVKVRAQRRSLKPLRGLHDVATGQAGTGGEEIGAVESLESWERPTGMSQVRPVSVSADRREAAAAGHLKSNHPSVKAARDFEETVEIVETIEAEEVSDSLADEIVDKVVEKLSDRLADKLADQIVERLYRLLTNNETK
jgi:hypothetical protein